MWFNTHGKSYESTPNGMDSFDLVWRGKFIHAHIYYSSVTPPVLILKFEL